MGRNIIFVIIGILLLGGMFFFFQPKTSQNNTSVSKQDNNHDTTKIMESTKKTFTLVLKDKKIVSGKDTLTVTQNDEVTMHITSDIAEELHLHGYDKSVDLEPNKQVTLQFTADKSGRFPFELEKSKTELGAVEVQPK